ncbi:universal stress protein [Paractinoplanes rhizophilus]|uniref:Universal stress protein n=1 Tax=Paractinoplanes rhizophilus TaxID=1416877 RepID=A0ABW2HX78_9ACTN
MSIGRIIVGYDRSADAKEAARWALDEAARTGAPVEFFYAYEWPVWAPAASMVPSPSVWPDSETVQAIKETLAEAVAAAALSHPGVRTTIVTATNEAALALVNSSVDAGMIVLGSRGHSAVVNLLGSVSSAVSARARCPVVVVRGRPDGTAPVVVGVDGSPPSEVAFTFAAEQAIAHGTHLRVIRAWKPVQALWSVPPTVERAVSPQQRKPFDDRVAAWRATYPQLEILAEAVVDHPASALTSASTHAQLVVVGSRGRGSLRGLLLGSVSQHLLRHAACAVAIAREPKD